MPKDKLKDIVLKDVKATIKKYSYNSFFSNINLEDYSSPDTITYKNHLDSMLNYDNYSESFIKFHENKQYFARIYDGSLIQAFYKFDSSLNVLTECNLSYIPNPGLENADFYDIETIVEPTKKNEYLSLLMEIESKYKNYSNYIRVDANKEHYREIYHPCCHMHIGLLEDFRISLQNIPLFSEFIDFICFYFYLEKWKVINNSLADYFKNKRLNKRIEELGSLLSDKEKMHHMFLIQ